MATKLKNIQLTSVDLVRAGANQEADICLFKSDDQAPHNPTEEERNIFKRFLGWLRENHSEEHHVPETHIEKEYTTFDQINNHRENAEKLRSYYDALATSMDSILNDNDLDSAGKDRMMRQSLKQFTAAMERMIGEITGDTPEYESIREVTPKKS